MASHMVVFLLSLIRNVELFYKPREEKEFIRFHLFSLLNAKCLFLFLSLGEMCEELMFRKRIPT